MKNNNCKLIHSSPKTLQAHIFFKKLIQILVILLFCQPCQSIFCSAHCSNYHTSCTTNQLAGCTTCEPTLYVAGCTLISNVVLDVSDVSTAITAANGYLSSNFTPISCTNTSVLPNVVYKMPGGFDSLDYLFKNYTFSVNHYSLIVRFSLGFIGVWSSRDYLLVQFQDAFNMTQQSFPYACTYQESICNSRLGNKVDCFYTVQYTLPHNNSFLAVNFSSMTSIVDTNFQFWTIRQIIIASLRCEQTCSTCTGPANNNCITCANGYYFNNNTCTTSCPIFILPLTSNSLTGTCVTVCPHGYYNISSIVNTTCLACTSGCLVCNATACIVLTVDEANVFSIGYQYVEIWFIAAIVVSFMISALIWRYCLTAHGIKEISQIPNVSMVTIDVSKNIIFEENITKVQQLQNMGQDAERVFEYDKVFHLSHKEPIRIDTLPRKKRGKSKNMEIDFRT